MIFYFISLSWNESKQHYEMPANNWNKFWSYYYSKYENNNNKDNNNIEIAAVNNSQSNFVAVVVVDRQPVNIIIDKTNLIARQGCIPDLWMTCVALLSLFFYNFPTPVHLKDLAH